VSEPTVTLPVGPEGTDVPLVRSPLAAIHAQLGADVAVEAGAETVRSYGSVGAEKTVIAETVGLADVTVRSKVDVRGDVDRVVSLFSADPVARIANDLALLLSRPGSVADRVVSMQTAVGDAAMVTDVTHLYAGFALCGPLLADAISRLSSWDPASLEPGTATGAPIADVRAIVVRPERPPDLLEVYVATELGRYVWGAIHDVVERLGGEPVGWDALRAQGWR
jgi:glycine cleavage system aminomethyltransferase T